GAEQLARGPVQHIEVGVFGRVHDDFAFFAIHGQFGQHQRIGAVVVPLLAGDFLVVPAVFAGGRIHGHDGTEEEVVAAFGAAEFHVVRGAVAGGEVDQAQLGVVDDGIP